MIVTHGGRFHLDEILAIATLFIFGELDYFLRYEKDFENIENNVRDMIVNIVREGATENDLYNESIWVLDVGKQYDTSKRNFDHHQSKNLMATNVLVLKHCCGDDMEMFNWFMEKLYRDVSNIDCGKLLKKDCNVMSLNEVVSYFNNVENGFFEALLFVSKFLYALSEEYKKVVKSVDVWDGFEKFENFALDFLGDHTVVDWQKFANRDNLRYMIKPNKRLKGSWGVYTVDQNKYPIYDSDGAIFVHNSGFMGVFNNLNSAIRFCEDN